MTVETHFIYKYGPVQIKVASEILEDSAEHYIIYIFFIVENNRIHIKDFYESTLNKAQKRLSKEIEQLADTDFVRIA